MPKRYDNRGGEEPEGDDEQRLFAAFSSLEEGNVSIESVGNHSKSFQ